MKEWEGILKYKMRKSPAVYNKLISLWSMLVVWQQQDHISIELPTYPAIFLSRLSVVTSINLCKIELSLLSQKAQRVQKLPDKTSERSSPDWNVYSWLCNEFQSRVPPSSPGKSCSSDRAPRRAGGWNRPSPASWRRRRKGRKEEDSRQKLANATPFLTLSLFCFWHYVYSKHCQFMPDDGQSCTETVANYKYSRVVLVLSGQGDSQITSEFIWTRPPEIQSS